MIPGRKQNRYLQLCNRAVVENCSPTWASEGRPGVLRSDVRLRPFNREATVATESYGLTKS